MENKAACSCLPGPCIMEIEFGEISFSLKMEIYPFDVVMIVFFLPSLCICLFCDQVLSSLSIFHSSLTLLRYIYFSFPSIQFIPLFYLFLFPFPSCSSPPSFPSFLLLSLSFIPFHCPSRVCSHFALTLFAFLRPRSPPLSSKN